MASLERKPSSRQGAALQFNSRQNPKPAAAPVAAASRSKSFSSLPPSKTPLDDAQLLNRSGSMASSPQRQTDGAPLKYTVVANGSLPSVPSSVPLKLFLGEAMDPVPELELGLDEADIRESAYELLVGAVGARADLRGRGSAGSMSRQLEKSPETTSFRLRMAFGLRRTEEGNGADAGAVAGSGAAGEPTAMEIVCRQLGITDFSDSRTRNALSRASASQVGKKLENLIAPLELLQYLGPTDFASQRDFVRWRKRQLSLLEQGLLKSPSVKSEGGDSASQKLQEILTKLKNGELDLQDAKTKQALRVAVLGKAEMGGGRGLDFRASMTRWADGFPFNMHMYMALLGACFKSAEETELIEEAEVVVEQITKAWPVLGITPTLHHLVFSWVLFRQFIKTGKKDAGVLEACVTQVREAIRLFLEDCHADIPKQQAALQLSFLKSTMTSLQAFAEKRLFTYHDAFPHGARGVMEQLVALALLAEDVLHSEEVEGYKAQNRRKGASPAQEKAETYIRSSTKAAFAQLHEAACSRRRSFRGSGPAPPALVGAAVDCGELAGAAVSLFAPAFREWLPSAAGAAAAQTHHCFRMELTAFLGQAAVLTQEAAQVLLAADRLEKQLVQMAVEDSTECEDGGAAAIQEMCSSPFEAEKAMATLLQKWVEDRLAKFGEWVDRTVEQEKWETSSLPEQCAPSAVDVARLMDETLTAFFDLPLPPDGTVLSRLAQGMEAALARYGKKVMAAIGSKEQFLPPLPPLTRYKKDVFVKTQQALLQQQSTKRPPGVATLPSTQAKPINPSSKMESMSLPRICCRMNTLQFGIKQMDELSNRIRSGWENSHSPPPPQSTSPKQKGVTSLFKTSKGAGGGGNIPLAPPLPSELLAMFEEVREEFTKEIAQLCDFAAYKVVFFDMKAAVMEGLYMGGVAHARMNGVIDALRPHLISIVDHVAPALRDRLVAALLRALLAALHRVLLAGGPARAYTIGDSKLLDDDLDQLRELFVDGGEGLPEADVNKMTALSARLLTLFSLDTDELIKNFEAADKEEQSSQNPPSNSASKLLKIPPLKVWSPTDANTILRVLCYRADWKCSKYLKKTFDLPKEVRR